MRLYRIHTSRNFASQVLKIIPDTSCMR